MELLGYILRIARFASRITNISDEILNLLSLFIFNKELSVYQVYKILNAVDKKIAYKNTHKKVTRLLDLELIERIDTNNIEEDENAKTPKFYRLSEEGIFTLFHYAMFLQRSPYYVKHKVSKEGIMPSPSAYQKEIFLNHRDCILFKIFLFPWISFKTIKGLSHPIISIIRRHITYCCDVVLEQVNLLEDFLLISEHKKGTPLPKSDYFDFMSLRKGMINLHSFPLNQLIKLAFDSNLEINRLEEGPKDSIMISDIANTKLIYLEYKSKENTLEISVLDDYREKIKLPANSINQILIPPIEYIENNKIINLRVIHLYAISSIMVDSIAVEDLNLLKNDSNFKITLQNLYQDFLKHYANMIQ